MKNLMILIIILGAVGCASQSAQIEQYGTMHQAIGQQKSQGRVEIKKLASRNNYIGIGAIENLTGEVTIVDGRVIATGVGINGEATVQNQAKQATLFVGANVKKWKAVTTPKDMTRKEFETWLKSTSHTSPIMFKIEGTITDVRLHVLNGACPVHARINNIALPKDKKPFEGSFKQITATIIGVYAEDAVGKLTHPDTSIHTHLIYKNDNAEELTGHLEDFKVAMNSSVFLPE